MQDYRAVVKPIQKVQVIRGYVEMLNLLLLCRSNLDEVLFSLSLINYGITLTVSSTSDLTVAAESPLL